MISSWSLPSTNAVYASTTSSRVCHNNTYSNHTFCFPGLEKNSRLHNRNVTRKWPASATRMSINSSDETWLEKLPEKNKPLYSHSLPCIEAWLRSLGFVQTKEDRATWTIERPDWHARLSLDITDLFIRYLKNGPGNLERDIERKFSYALSRDDLENAILGGP